MKWKHSSRIDKKVIIMSKVIHNNRKLPLNTHLNRDFYCWYTSWFKSI